MGDWGERVCHSGLDPESRLPFNSPLTKGDTEGWIPAFAGMTVKYFCL
jgi:hypothetical protein